MNELHNYHVESLPTINIGPGVENIEEGSSEKDL